MLMPAGRNGPAFIVTPNFYVLKDYNKSDLYALFVGHVGDRIQYGVETFLHLGVQSILFIDQISQQCSAPLRNKAMMSVDLMVCQDSKPGGPSGVGRKLLVKSRPVSRKEAWIYTKRSRFSTT